MDLKAWFDALPALDLENFDEFDGFDGFDTQYEIAQVAELLSEGPCPGLFVTPESDSDGVIGGFSVSIDIVGSRFYLGISHDWKGMTDDRGATGRDAAWNIAASIYRDWLDLRSNAEAYGMKITEVTP